MIMATGQTRESVEPSDATTYNEKKNIKLHC